jgi:hypothetical protein
MIAVLLAFTGSALAWDRSGTQLYIDDADNLIFSYYDIRTMAQGGPGLSDNYFSIINDDDDEFYQMHIRVRTGQCSVELLDFDALLSPNDVFTFDLIQDAEGDTVFASCDTKTLISSQFSVDANGCFVLDSGTFPAMLSLIQACGNCPDGSGAPLSASTALEATRVGYVEVIGEVQLCASDNTSCSMGSSSADECTTEQLENGDYNAWTFQEDINDGGDCATYANTNDPDQDLFGKAYHAAFDAQRNLTQLATSNAWEGARMGPPLIHRPCFSDSSPGCQSGDGELENPTGPGYAYDVASTSPDGAQDMNQCFWTAMVNSNTDINRVGAAATFGPTQADTDDFVTRGTATDTEELIDDYNSEYDEDDAVSHYFFIPGRGQTRYVFTFPLQHFVNQEISITKDERYDTEEAECVLPAQKFISPGIPQPGVVAGEVAILPAHSSNDGCDFNEGWIEFELEVTDDGPNSEPSIAAEGNSTAGDDPATIGMIVLWGEGAIADIFDISPMHMD